jgi:hypothetical protein
MSEAVPQRRGKGRGATAKELEKRAAAIGPPRPGRPAPSGEAMAMLVRRGLRPRRTRPDLVFPPGLGEDAADSLSARLGHYAFRLFLRGALKHPDGFSATEATDYLPEEQRREAAEALVDLGIAVRAARGRYRFLRSARSFGGTLEWYVARELERRFGFDVAAGIKFYAPGVGGDLDIVAAAEGKLVYLEIKSSPPKHLRHEEVAAFFDRVVVLRPDVTLFVMDTALRLSDKVLPMLLEELARRRGTPMVEARRVERELFAVTPHLFAVNSKPDLIANIGRAIAEGFSALAPQI